MQKTSCGYCKGGSGGKPPDIDLPSGTAEIHASMLTSNHLDANYYMTCENMRVDHYQALMDRGWRRYVHPREHMRETLNNCLQIGTSLL